MTARIYDLAAYRASGQIVERVPVQCSEDVRVEFARRVERAFFSQFEARMEGRLPGRFAEDCLPPKGAA